MRLKKVISSFLVVVMLSFSFVCVNATTVKKTPPVKSSTKPVNVKSTRLFPYSTEGKFSYVDVNGKVILKTNYGFADDFVGGYAHVMTDICDKSYYINSKGNRVASSVLGKNIAKVNFEFRGAREIKGDVVVDLSKKVKRYTSTHDGWKADNEDYNIGDGFEVRTWQASGAPCTRLYKNGKQICSNINELETNDVFLIVKYDNEKIIRFLYADCSNGLMKTIFVDYNGKQIWNNIAVKPVVTPAKPATPPAKPATPSVSGSNMTGLEVDDFLSRDDIKSAYYYVGYDIDKDYLTKAQTAVKLVNAAIVKKLGAALANEQLTEMLTELNKGKDMKSKSMTYTVNNSNVYISLYHNTDATKVHLKEININVTLAP